MPTFNLLAFLIGPFWYLLKGMWLKAVVLGILGLFLAVVTGGVGRGRPVALLRLLRQLGPVPVGAARTAGAGDDGRGGKGRDGGSVAAYKPFSVPRVTGRSESPANAK